MITYCYDALNRLTGKRYAAASCPLSSYDFAYFYDSLSPWGYPSPNTVGRLVAQTNGTNTYSFQNYDPMGRLYQLWTCLPPNCNAGPFYTAAQYDFAGDLMSLTYPSVRNVTYSYDSDMRPTQAQLYSFNGTQIGYNYLSGATYSPLGGPTSVTLGSGVKESTVYDDRMQFCNLQVATGTFTWLNRTNNYYPTPGTNCQPGTGGNNGNVMSIIDNIQSNNTETFGYDSVNRLTSAQTQGTSGPNCWGQSYGYDAWANLLSATATLSGCPMTQLNVTVNSQNQITNTGIQYDQAGDMLKDGVNTYSYDAESRISTVNTSAATYSYDGFGQRVQKQTSSGTTDYVYFNGQPIAEYNSSGVWSDYIFVGSRRLALANDSNEGSVSNGSFEQGLTGWSTNGTLENNAGNAHSGSYYVLLPSTGQQVEVAGPTVPVSPGDQITFGGWDYLEAGTGGPIGTGGYNGWWLAVFNSQGQAINYVTAGGSLSLSTWTYQSATYTVPAGAASVQLYAQVYQPTSNPTNLRVDDGFLSTGTIYYHSDHLGSARFTSDSGGNVIWSATYLPFGQEWNPQLTTNHYKFTGKERDSESGLDNFGARYDSSQYGRFMTPDWSARPSPVPYARLGNPQSLNLYSYALNNPVTNRDADGHYEFNGSDCGDNTKCQKKWDKAENKFETQRAKDLNSKKADVRAAAAAYGARGEANGVHVGFANLSGQHIYGSVDAGGSQPGLQPLVQVTIDFGRAGNSETITHEGTHVGDDMSFLNSGGPFTGYNQALNLTHGQTEFNAFRAGAEINQEHGFGPNDNQKIWDYIRVNYPAPLLNTPVFDPNRFSVSPFSFTPGAPDDEQ